MSNGLKFDRRGFLGISVAALTLDCSSKSDGTQAQPAADASADAAEAGTDAEAGLDADSDAGSDAGPPPPDTRYGWDPDFDAGTSGDLFVDASVAASGDGLTVATAFKTLGEALEKAKGDGEEREIKVLGGTYRESVRLDGFQGRISGYGTAKPVFTGAEVLAGWTPCTPADESDVGPNYTDMFKASISTDAFASSTPAGLNLYEDSEPLRLVQDRLGEADLFFVSYDEDFHTADSFGLDAADNVVSITHVAVFSKYTAEQLNNAFVYLYHAPNAVSAVSITSVDMATHTLGVDGGHAVQSATDPEVWRYSLANVLPAIQKGQWGFKRDGAGGTVTVYCWPNDPADVTDRIEYSARTFCVDVPPSTGTVTLEGLDFRQTGGDGSAEDGVCIGTLTSTINKKHGLTIRHVRAGRTFNPLGSGYGALYLANIDDCTVEHVTVEYASGCFGVFLQGRTTDPMVGTKLRRYHARFVSNAGARFYGQFLCEFSHSLLEDNGYGGHTNQFNFYEQCDRVLVYGVRTRRCMGYATYQEASRLFFGCCEIGSNPRSGSSARALADQQNATPPPQTACDNWVWNSLFLPAPNAPDKANSVNLGADAYPDIRWNLINCVVHGGGMPPAYTGSTPSVEHRREGNVYTGKAYWNETGYGWSLNGTEAMETDLSKVYADAQAEDFTPVTGSLLLTHTGVDIAEAIAAAKEHFPNFDFSVDLEGDALDTASPACGPRADPSKGS